MSQDLNITYAPLIELTRNFCITVENAAEADRQAFTAEMLDMLPRLYLAFSELDSDTLGTYGDEYLPQYLDRTYYDSISRQLQMLFGAYDTYLETFESDMKYSDSPIAASISEGIADIFQDLYNCVCAIKESDGLQTGIALSICKENFQSYWSQVLCNVMRPLNHLNYNLEINLP